MSTAFCGKLSHDNQKIKYLCIDPFCHSSEKLGCADCFLEDHASHQRVHTEEFINQASSKLQELKSIHCESVFNAIQDLHKSIDTEFESCAGAIMQRFEKVRQTIKQGIDQDAIALQNKQEEVNSNIQLQAQFITSLVNKPTSQLDDDEVSQMARLFHELPSIQTWANQQVEQLKVERDAIKQKKLKQLKKLNQVVNTLLREFGDKISPDKDTDLEEVPSPSTPDRKRTAQTMLQNSQTKSPPSRIVEMVRKGRSTNSVQQQNKKSSVRKKIVALDE